MPEITKLKLTEFHRTRSRPEAKPYLLWDTDQKGLALQVRPNGYRAFKVIYSFHNRVRWFHLESANAIGLEDARKLARKVMYAVADGKDPQAEKKAQRSVGTFEELADRYRDEHAKKENKSWKQSDALVRNHLIPRWGKLQPAHITRDDVEQRMKAIKGPIAANQTLAAASAIFTWAVKKKVVTLNPCTLVDRNKTTKRARVLSKSELPLFWQAFERHGEAGKVLQLILLLGQRPGEVRHLRAEHVIDGWWWKMPGEPIKELRWPGTKNKKEHWVWLPRPVQDLLGEVPAQGSLLAGPLGGLIKNIDEVMRTICSELRITDKVTPHDLRRTHGSTITGLGFGRDAMNRIQNHKEGGIADVYDQHKYADENKRIMEAVAAHLIGLAQGRPAVANVVAMQQRAR